MSGKYTKHTLASRTNWKKLYQKDDSDIDYTDNPSTDEAFWASAEVIMPCSKKHISVRFDQDIIAFFKKQGKGYQSMMNSVLRSYMQSKMRKTA